MNPWATWTQLHFSDGNGRETLTIKTTVQHLLTAATMYGPGKIASERDGFTNVIELGEGQTATFTPEAAK